MDRAGIDPMAIEQHAVVCSSTCTVSMTHTRDCFFHDWVLLVCRF